MDLNNNFTTGNNLHPKYRPQNIHILDKYSKIVVPKTSTSKGLLFAQGDASKGKFGGGRYIKRGGDNKKFDKRYWNDKECYKCGKKWHPVSCGKNYEDDNDNITETNAIRASVKNLTKDVKKTTIAFTSLNTQLQQLKEDNSDLYDSGEEDKASHFKISENSGFQLSQLNEEFEPQIVNFFNHSDGRNVGINTKLDLLEVILLDSHSTIYFLCRQYLLEKTTNPKTKMRLMINGGTMMVLHKVTVTDYHNSVWFREKSTTNIIKLINLRL